MRKLGVDVDVHEKGLEDRSNRAAAIHTFKHLRHHGYTFPLDDLQARTLAHGWPTDDAQQLSECANRVLTGMRYHTAPNPFGVTAINQWREEATNATPPLGQRKRCRLGSSCASVGRTPTTRPRNGAGDSATVHEVNRECGRLAIFGQWRSTEPKPELFDHR